MDTKKLIHDTVVATLAACGIASKPTDYFKATEARLYAYPVLLENIRQYKLDIADLKAEKVTEKSKDITCWTGGSGVRLTPEEKQEARIMAVEVKLQRDWAEVNTINRGLQRLRDHFGVPAVDFLEKIYFSGVDLQQLAEEDGSSLSSIQRRRTHMVRKMSLILYGAEALK